MTEPVFDRDALVEAFRMLADRLACKSIVGQVHVVGGAAMVLAYDSRRITRDIDALFAPDGPLLEAVKDVADVKGWPRSWLNNQASVFVARSPGAGTNVFDHPNLQVVATPADHLLAMKVLAARSTRDGEDITLLLDHLGLTEPQQVWDIVCEFFPDEAISDRSRMLVEDLLCR